MSDSVSNGYVSAHDSLGPCYHTHYEGGPHCVHTAWLAGYEARGLASANADNDPNVGERRHDPLCPWVGYSVMDCDDCDLIAKVRADMLAKCIAAAEQAYQQAPKNFSDNEAAELAFYALRSLQEKP